MNVAPDPIFQVASGFMAAKHLFMANEFGLFEKLAEGPATLDTLAEAAAPVPLNHPHCARFCVLGGAACSG